MRLILPCISGLELGGRFEKAGGFIQSPAGSFAVCLGLHAQELLKSDYLQSTKQGVMSEIRIQETQLFRVRTSTKIWGNHGKSGSHAPSAIGPYLPRRLFFSLETGGLHREPSTQSLGETSIE